MDIKRSGSQPSTKGPAEYFTGTVRIDPMFQANDPARVVGASVTFEPGSRTAWHSHPLGQILIVTAGCGLVQRWDGPVEEIHPGDVVWIPPSEKHWHGATMTTAMTHIAIQEQLDGRGVDWMEQVSDEALLAALGELPADDMDVLNLYYFEDLTDREIAERTVRSTDSVKKQRQRAIAGLRRRLHRGDRQPAGS